LSPQASFLMRMYMLIRNACRSLPSLFISAREARWRAQSI
jgi:hypothetical protein